MASVGWLSLTAEPSDVETPLESRSHLQPLQHLGDKILATAASNRLINDAIWDLAA